ncbi:putative catalytic [Hibiscus syriacus]|uniref:Catalytic n=1 Tax=Hibiscus syriacus TaxID=106335 RepID=A0A6A3D013_HIBSY|nr:putative catalytic [Hibiscus syriacus]
MATDHIKKLSAASATPHTRRNTPKSTSLPGLLGWACQALKPPPPRICGSADGPPVTSSRIKLDDGRHLAYREAGVPREEAKYKIVVIHGFDSSKDLNLPTPQELRIYFLFFDRAGYGDSDPNPYRSVKSEAYDVQELADKLAGASLVVPFVNYWWPRLPANISNEAFGRLLAQDQWSFRVAHYPPWLFYWWMSQKWFP